MRIKITNLKKCYGNTAALNGISLTVGNGMYGLLRRNGA